MRNNLGPKTSHKPRAEGKTFATFSKLLQPLYLLVPRVWQINLHTIFNHFRLEMGFENCVSRSACRRPKIGVIYGSKKRPNGNSVRIYDYRYEKSRIASAMRPSKGWYAQTTPELDHVNQRISTMDNVCSQPDLRMSDWLHTLSTLS